MNLQNTMHLNQVQHYLGLIGQHLKYTNIKFDYGIDDVVLNSFMDICVKFQKAEWAIDLYNLELEHRNRAPKQKANQNSQSIFSDQLQILELEKKTQVNKIIQIGILIKAYGQLG